MNKFYVFIATLILGGSAYAQQDIQVSQAYFNRLLYNPAVAGSNDGLCGTLTYRNQWVGFGDGNPKDLMVNGHYGFSDPWLGMKHGVGIVVISDQIGPFTALNAKLDYAFRYPVGQGMLSAGLGLGYTANQVTSEWYSVDDPNFDPSLPTVGSSVGGFDMDFGLYYKIPNKLYVGISSTHLTQPLMTEENINNSGANNFLYSSRRHYYLTAGYTAQLSDPNFVLKPYTLVKTDGAVTTFDIGSLVEYKGQFWGGLAYRFQDAVVPMVGMMKATNNGGTFRFGYSYDVTTSKLASASSGTHEIMLNYCMPIERVIPTTRSSDVRNLY